MKPASNPEYFELTELPGQPYFRCERLRASLSVDACGARWKTADTASTDLRWITCKNCPIGAAHAGRLDANPSPLAGRKICARCHVFATRLIQKHLCVSCYNRQRERTVGKNAKGTKPVKLAPLRRRTIAYMAGGKLKAKTIDLSVDTAEAIIAVLRDEERAVRFQGKAPAMMLTLLQRAGANK